jgi:hypothetical protein
MGLWVSPKHIHPLAFLFFAFLPLLEVTSVLLLFPFPLDPPGVSLLVLPSNRLTQVSFVLFCFSHPPLVDENFVLVLATLDIPFRANTVSNGWIHGVVARSKREHRHENGHRNGDRNHKDQDCGQDTLIDGSRGTPGSFTRQQRFCLWRSVKLSVIYQASSYHQALHTYYHKARDCAYSLA